MTAALLFIAVATLMPVGHAPPRFQWRLELADLAVNLALYFPLGVVLARNGLRRRDVALVALLLSGAIEATQGLLIAGRRGSPPDVVANLTGCLLGAVAWSVMARAMEAPSAKLRRALAIVLPVPVIGWFLLFLLLAPAPPETPSWYSLWAHQYADTEPFRGTIVEVRLQDRVVPDGPIQGVPALVADGRARGLRLQVTLISDGRTTGVTQLASIGDMRDKTVIGLEQVGDDLLLFWASRGSALRLRPPRLTFPGAARAERGERLTIRAVVTGSRAGVQVERTDGSAEAATRLTPFTGWRSLIPSRDLSAGLQRFCDVVWTLGLVGYLGLAVRMLRSVRPSY